jgi:hypothetical protein
MNREDGYSLSKSWKPLIIGSLHHITVYLSSLWDHTGLCTLSLSGNKIWPPWALSSLHPDVLASFHYLCSLIPHCKPVTHEVDSHDKTKRDDIIKKMYYPD